jgi:predicted RNA binding protein YcfA (HicA-like mRNA interferase family)
VRKEGKLRAKVRRLSAELRIEDAVALLEGLGWTLGWTHRRISGSHHQFTKEGRRTLVVVVHGGKISRPATRDIVRELDDTEHEDGARQSPSASPDN